MKQVCLFALALIPFNRIAAQEVHHAPTVDQCRADQNLWQSMDQDKTPFFRISFKELGEMNNEMVACGKVDPNRVTQYDKTSINIFAAQKVRLIDFLHRHHLWDQFLAEDAQGKR